MKKHPIELKLIELFEMNKCRVCSRLQQLDANGIAVCHTWTINWGFKNKK